VTREEGHALAFERTGDDGVGGLAKRGFNANFASLTEAVDAVKAAATDNADGHSGCGVF
jgi:hypothetical protein